MPFDGQLLKIFCWFKRIFHRSLLHVPLALSLSIFHHQWEFTLYPNIKTKLTLCCKTIQNKEKKNIKNTDFQWYLTILDVLYMEKVAGTGAEEWSNHFHLEEEEAWDGLGMFLPVKQTRRRKEVLELLWFPTQGFYFVLENLIFPRPFLLGLSLKSALYWEIGMKSTALKGDKGLCLQNVHFVWNCKGSGTRNGFKHIMLRFNLVILSQVKICYRSILSIPVFFSMCLGAFT